MLLSGSVLAQQLPAQPPVKLELSVDQVKMIVDALPSIGCQNVAQLIVCNKAIALLEEIRRQAREQIK